MKKKWLVIVSFLPSLLMAQLPTEKKVSSTITKEYEATAATMVPKKPTNVMIIDPTARANDMKNAFNFLRKETAASKISIVLTDGSKLHNILEMDVMTGGTLIIFKVSTIQGEKYRVEKIENISSIAIL